MNLADIEQVIVFDGECGLCNRFVRFAVKIQPKREIKFMSSQSQPGESLLNELAQDLQPSTVLLISPNSLLEKSGAVFSFLKQAKRPWCWLRIFQVLPKFISDGIYNFIAKNRHLIFKKSQSCSIDPKVQARILDDENIDWSAWLTPHS